MPTSRPMQRVRIGDHNGRAAGASQHPAAEFRMQNSDAAHEVVHSEGPCGPCDVPLGKVCVACSLGMKTDMQVGKTQLVYGWRGQPDRPPDWLAIQESRLRLRSSPW